MLNRDPEEKRRRGYSDPKSFVRIDGSEVLHGWDWTTRKEELFKRCKGKCEWIVDAGLDGAVIMVYACGKDIADPHHIKPRSKGRDDRLSNLQALCRYHHDLLDKRKPRWSRKVEAT